MRVRFRSQRRISLLGAAVAVLAAPVAAAQQTAPTPTPAPAPRQQGPAIITLPGAERFDLRPSNPRAATPTSTPAPQPTVTPPPIAAPTPAATRAARVPAARPAPSPAAAPTMAAPTSAPAATPTMAAPTQLPSAPVPVPTAIATPASDAAVGGGFPWLWAIGGVALLALAVAGTWLMRRRRPAPEAAPPQPASPVAAPPPAPRPVAPSPAPRSAPAPGLAEPIGFEFRPAQLELTAQGATIEFELLLANLTAAPADGVRVWIAMISANPGQDALIEQFGQSPPLPPVAPPFDLAARSAGRIPGRIFLGHEQVHVVQLGGRPMFVPLVLIDVRWRGGLSVRHNGAAFMVGTAGQGDKPGPIWLDRGPQRHPRLTANRYFRKSAVQAAE